MSYDVSVSGEDHFNITSNMAAFFREFKCYPPDWDGKLAVPWGQFLDDSIHNIVATSVRELQEFDAPNGWGDWHTTLQWLMQVRDACFRAPRDARIEVSH